MRKGPSTGFPREGDGIDETLDAPLGYMALLVASVLGVVGCAYGLLVGPLVGLSAWEWVTMSAMGLVCGGVGLTLWLTGERYLRPMANVIVVTASFYLISNISNAILLSAEPAAGFIYLAWFPVLFAFIGAMYTGRVGLHLTWTLFAALAVIVATGIWAGRLRPTEALGNAVVVHLMALGTFIALLYAVAAYRARFAAASARSQALAEGAAKLQEVAYRDSLTGLPNRKLLLERLVQLLAIDHREGRGLVVHYFGLDGFQEVNVSLGRDQGDEVLTRIGERLAKGLRQGDTVARIGADEFALIQQGGTDDNSAGEFVNRLRKDVARPIVVREQELRLSVSVGSATMWRDNGSAPDFHLEADTLLRQAETAMRAVKAAGGSGWRLFDETMAESSDQRLVVRSGLWRALERNEFRLHYQPQVELTSERLIGAEALIRWQDPAYGLRGPADFIPVAESTGAIVAMGEWVLHEACMAAAAWPSASASVEVNVSPLQVERSDLVAVVREALDASGLPPHRLGLELTESVFARAGDARFRQAFGALREMGVGLVVDDFGTGYSSLLYLKHFPVTMLKIDRAFVAGLDAGHVDLAIVKAIITFARAMNVELLAEGIETEAQRQTLLREGCRYGQGFLFDRPLEGATLVQRYFEGARRGAGS